MAVANEGIPMHLLNHYYNAKEWESCVYMTKGGNDPHLAND